MAKDNAEIGGDWIESAVSIDELVHEKDVTEKNQSKEQEEEYEQILGALINQIKSEDDLAEEKALREVLILNSVDVVEGDDLKVSTAHEAETAPVISKVKTDGASSSQTPLKPVSKSARAVSQANTGSGSGQEDEPVNQSIKEVWEGDKALTNVQEEVWQGSRDFEEQMWQEALGLSKNNHSDRLEQMQIEQNWPEHKQTEKLHREGEAKGIEESRGPQCDTRRGSYGPKQNIEQREEWQNRVRPCSPTDITQTVRSEEES
jgi:hypothetical protein